MPGPPPAPLTRTNVHTRLVPRSEHLAHAANREFWPIWRTADTPRPTIARRAPPRDPGAGYRGESDARVEGGRIAAIASTRRITALEARSL
ncbi:hypothetical protein, partial [Streptomyces eurythermus]|uniref:hypothetical protein n=1 Tax=Streptomyces eurythermus TaxID=42237 RepID=UPI00340D5AE6